MESTVEKKIAIEVKTKQNKNTNNAEIYKEGSKITWNLII